MPPKSKNAECVKVVVRCRPLLPDEVAANYSRVVSMDTSKGEVAMVQKARGRGGAAGEGQAAGEELRRFTFDAVYDWTSKQRDLYDQTFKPIVEAVLQGYNGTVFAYGQTGSGKTFTMAGERGDPEKQGLIPNSFDHIFSHIARTQDEQYLVRVSYLEIYKEEVRDLLSKDHKRRLKLRERPDTGVYVEDLSSFVAKSVREVEHVMTVGGENRKVGPTNMNQHSSRSHAIFIMTVECCARGADGEDHIRVGKLNLVDLAGSERQSKTGATGERFQESTKINLSLSALGNVISALVDGRQSHVPYRDSHLTRLLQDSLGGNAKTVMVANIGPADYNYEETLITLRYANRAKNIQNQPRINEDPKDALLREFQEEIHRLKSALDKRRRKGDHSRQRKSERGGGSGEESEGEEEEGEEGGGEGGSSLAAQQRQLEAEKEALLHNTGLVLEERERLVAEVQQKVDRLKKEQRKRDALAAKIKAMESKLLVGGRSIVDHTHEQQKKLDQHKQEIAQQELKEREMKQQLEAREEGNLEIRETFSSLREEVESRTKKLNKLSSKLREVREEMEEREEDHSRDREQLAIAAQELQKELSLRQLIVENFVPPAEAVKVKGRAVLNVETDEWTLTPVQASDPRLGVDVPRPVSRVGSLRPMSTSARMAAAIGNPRYMAENVLRVELDMPARTTRDYECPSVAPSLKAALSKVMEEDEEIAVDASLFTPSHKTRSFKTKTRLRHSSEPVANSRSTHHFPTSRGLVTPTV